jgi:uncharacterized Zn ribbon protein
MDNSLQLKDGSEVRGVELNDQDHPGHDPFGMPISSVFIQFLNPTGTVVKMIRLNDEATIYRKIEEFKANLEAE